MSWPALEVDTYHATDKFRAIESHTCVCTAEDGGLMAVTGPAHDAKAQRYARLFATAPELLEALETLLGYATKADSKAVQKARAAIAKATAKEGSR